MSRSVRLLVAGSVLCVTILSVARAAVFWSTQAYLDSISGSWTALAVDLANGTFYRPLFGPLGYGGTRYFPLHPSLHALLIALHLDAVSAGLLLSGFSIVLLCGAVYAVLVALGVSRSVAASCGALVVASQTAQEALLSIKGDALAAALSIWGLAAVIGLRDGRRRIVVAAALFTLAFATKVTAISGLLAAVVWLWVDGRRSTSLTLAGASAVGFAVVTAIVTVGASGLQVWGGVGSAWRFADLVMAPVSLAQLMRQVPETLVFVQLGLAASAVMFLSDIPSVRPAWLFLGSALAATMPIFMFEGTDTNHLIDLHAASLVAVGSWIGLASLKERDFSAAALAVAGLAASLSLASGLVNARGEQRGGTFEQALELIGDRPGPLLAENALVPIARGEQPYMIDSYMFRLARQRDPDVVVPLWTALRERHFAAVVLERDPHTERGTEWYRSGFFGEGFIDALEQTYQVGGRVKGRIIYLPR